MRWLTAAGMILLVWFILLVIFTPNMLLGLQRMFQPWNAAAAVPQGNWKCNSSLTGRCRMRLKLELPCRLAGVGQA
jgi:hypothetical protein